MFRVFKDKSGKYRWFSISSSAFEDRDGEIVSTDAVDYSLKIAKTDPNYGELRLYHLPGSRIGECDTSMRIGMFLIESGIFDNTDMATNVRKVISNNPDKYGVSIGFKYRPEDFQDNTYHRIKIFERSIVEEKDAAALFTNIRLTENWPEESTMENEKVLIKKLSDLVGGDTDLARELLKQANSVGVKMRADEQIGFKEGDDNKDIAPETAEHSDVPNEETKESVDETQNEKVKEAEAKDESAGESKEDEIVEESKSADEPQATDVLGVKDFVLELDEPTLDTLAEQIAERMPSQQETLNDLAAQVKSIQEALVAIGDMVEYLATDDATKLRAMQEQMPRFRLTHRPSTETKTVGTPPEESEPETTTKFTEQTLADSIAAIKNYRLRIVS